MRENAGPDLILERNSRVSKTSSLGFDLKITLFRKVFKVDFWLVVVFLVLRTTTVYRY